MNKYIYYIWLNFIEISADKKMRLIEYFGSAEAVYHAQEEDYIASELLDDKNIKPLLDKSLKQAEKEYKRAEKYGVSFVCIEDEIYPKNLLNIYDPPVLLYAKGNVSLLKKELCFCIVGMRECTGYGLTAAMEIASSLAQCGMIIVSGCAIGIDSAAHQGAMRGGGKTIGVAACGLNVDYPAGNSAVRKKMVQEGLIISEYPFDTPAHHWNFQKRNRILSGLSLGTAVIEAGMRSGALITAKHTKEQNRDLFALPGNITSRTSVGCNKLINEGASVILGAETILSEYLPRYPELFEIDDYLEEYEQQKKEEAEVSASNLKDTIENGETDDEKKILKLLKDGEKNFDELAVVTEMQVSKLNVLLTTMQIKGLIVEKSGRTFLRK